MRDALKPEFRNRIHIVVKGTGLHTVDLFDYALRESRLSGRLRSCLAGLRSGRLRPSRVRLRGGQMRSKSDETTAFHALWSNPCFSLDVATFRNTTAEMTSAEAIAKTDDAFRKYLKRPYKKSDTNFSRTFPVSSLMPSRTRNVSTDGMRERCMTNPSVMNPGTHLYEIVNTLQDYLR